MYLKFLKPIILLNASIDISLIKNKIICYIKFNIFFFACVCLCYALRKIIIFTA